MDAERIKELREWVKWCPTMTAELHMTECLDEIERLQAEVEDWKFRARYWGAERAKERKG